MGAAQVPGRPSICHHSRLAQATPQGAHRIPGAAGEPACYKLLVNPIYDSFDHVKKKVS